MTDDTITNEQREIFFHTLGGRDDWTPEQKEVFWKQYDDEDVSLAFGVGAV